MNGKSLQFALMDMKKTYQGWKKFQLPVKAWKESAMKKEEKDKMRETG